MASRVAKFKKSTMRRGRKASRKAARRGRSRRQRGGVKIEVYATIDAKYNISNIKSATPGVTGTGGAVTCTLNFNPAVTVTNVTFSTHNGTAWGAEKLWNKTASGTGAPILRSTKMPFVEKAALGTQAVLSSAPIPSLTITTFSLANLGAMALDPAKKNATNDANLRITITTIS
jgi:hypothetical protein